MSHTNVTEDMKILTSDIVTQDLMILPEKVWLRVKVEMDAKHPDAANTWRADLGGGWARIFFPTITVK